MRTDISLCFVGSPPDDLRFFIRAGAAHAGGITLHGIAGDSFSYGIAIAPALRRQGVARAALCRLFARMKAKGFGRAVVQVKADNAASLALHGALGFACVAQEEGVITMIKAL